MLTKNGSRSVQFYGVTTQGERSMELRLTRACSISLALVILALAACGPAPTATSVAVLPTATSTTQPSAYPTATDTQVPTSTSTPTYVSATETSARPTATLVTITEEPTAPATATQTATVAAEPTQAIMTYQTGVFQDVAFADSQGNPLEAVVTQVDITANFVEGVYGTHRYCVESDSWVQLSFFVDPALEPRIVMISYNPLRAAPDSDEPLRQDQRIIQVDGLPVLYEIGIGQDVAQDGRVSYGFLLGEVMVTGLVRGTDIPGDPMHHCV